MSGIFSRTQYDECYFDEYKKINQENYNYSLFLNYNVNPNMKANMKICLHNNVNPNMKVCLHNNDKQDKCYQCDLNNEATLDITPEYFKKITEIDGNLKGINRQLTYCYDKKFKGCFSESEECINNIMMNPYLCDREIVPTNMKKF
jgi:hypothetical protein